MTDYAAYLSSHLRFAGGNGVERKTQSSVRSDARLRMLAQRVVGGELVKNIAPDLGITYGYARALMTKPRYREIAQDLLQKMAATGEAVIVEGHRNVNEAIQNAAFEALITIERLMKDGASDAIKFQAAKDILDRAGYSAPKAVLAEHHVTLDAASCELLSRVWHETGKANAKTLTIGAASVS